MSAQLVESLVKELDGISNLMDAQQKAGMHKDEVLQSLFRSWSARLSTQPMQKLSVLERQQLTAAITACPWSAEQCKSLAETVLTSGSRKLTASNIKATQKCPHFENFIPTDVVLKLKARTQDDQATYSVLSRLSFIACSARQIGIVIQTSVRCLKRWGLCAYMTQSCKEALSKKKFMST